MTPAEPEVSATSTIKVQTPDGTMFVHVMELNSGVPYKIDLSIGKAGSAIQAWAQAVARLASLALRRGALLSELAEEISSITTDRLTVNGGRVTRSGPDGIAQALVIYIQSKKPAVVKRKRRRGPSFYGEEFDD